MDTAAAPNQLDQTYRLLALCARADGHPVSYDQLRTQLRAFRLWDLLLAQAELHGMGALLRHHLRQAGLEAPGEADRTLTGLYLRQRALNRHHTDVLLEVHTLLEAHAIHPVLLKGLALAYGYYPDPAVRAVGDIDLLLQPEQVYPAVDVLQAAGFTAERPATERPATPPAEVRLLAPASRGLRTLIELHHGHAGRWPLLGPARDVELAGLGSAWQMLDIHGRLVRIPAPAATLSYLSRHLQRHLFEASASRPLPLKWVADILSVVERHIADPAWADRLRHDDALMARLEVFYSLTPAPESLTGIFPAGANRPPAGINHYPGGWPRQKFGALPKVGPLRFVYETWARPSPWWLRLHYGIRQPSCWWYAAVIHPGYVLNLVIRGFVRRTLLAARRVLGTV